LRAYIVGRKPDVARRLIEECAKTCPNVVFRAKVTDLALLSDADVAIKDTEKMREGGRSKGE